MEKSEIEFLIYDVIRKTEEIVSLQYDIAMINPMEMDEITQSGEKLQLLYINRDLSIEELKDLGEG